MKLAKAIVCLALLPFCVLGGLLIGLIVAVAYTITLADQVWRAFK